MWNAANNLWETQLHGPAWSIPPLVVATCRWADLGLRFEITIIHPHNCTQPSQRHFLDGILCFPNMYDLVLSSLLVGLMIGMYLESTCRGFSTPDEGTYSHLGFQPLFVMCKLWVCFTWSSLLLLIAFTRLRLCHAYVLLPRSITKATGFLTGS